MIQWGEMKKLPIGIQSIEKILEEGYVYVDKTALLHALITGGAYYFLSRPRRFGKSLLIDTLRAIFTGKRKMFKGCAISSLDYDWKEYPVIHLDFSLIARGNPTAFREALQRRLEAIASDYEVSIACPTLEEGLIDLVHRLEAKTKEKVVILVDEYDKPLIDHLHDPETAKGNRAVQKDFFTVIKGLDAKLRFVFVTGVSKFSQVSLFSGMNNLYDITVSAEYASLLGYTEQEIASFFQDHIGLVAQKSQKTFDEVVDLMRQWYNGYRFSEQKGTVYNPFSTLLFLKNGKTGNYWFQTATPTFLIEQIRQQKYPVDQLSDIDVGDELFNNHDVEKTNLISLMWQTGYLTIRGYDPESLLYRLAYPNEEVKTSFLKSLAAGMTGLAVTQMAGYAHRMSTALQEQNLEAFFEKMQAFFATTPYDMHVGEERYYQTIFYVAAKLIGLEVELEVKTNVGRIDMIVMMDTTVYIFEFKIDSTPKKALQQIKEKKYFQKFLDSDKDVILVGVGFSTKQRNISGWTASPARSYMAKLTAL